MPEKKEGPGIAESSMWPLRAIGAVQGARIDFEGVDEKHAVQWLEPIERPRYEPGREDAGPAEDDSTGVYSQFTGFVPEDMARLDRDPHPGADPDSGDPSRPTPKLADLVPTCKEWSGAPGSSFCMLWEGQEVVTPDGGQEISVYETDEDKLQDPDTGRGVAIGCYEPGIEGPGVAVGIHGGLAFKGLGPTQPPERIVEEGGGLGSFYFICAPYSGISYTENWRFLRVKGGSIPRELDTVSGPYRWGFFDDFFSRVYEQRYHPDMEGGVMVRPASAKMCPPNYLMNGLTFARSAEGRFLGVKSLRCVSPESNSGKGGNDVLTVYLKDSDVVQDRGWSTFERDFDYALRGKDFSLSQYVGYPECSGTNCSLLECPNDDRGNPKVVKGFRAKHDTEGLLENINLVCLEAP